MGGEERRDVRGEDVTWFRKEANDSSTICAVVSDNLRVYRWQ